MDAITPEIAAGRNYKEIIDTMIEVRTTLGITQRKLSELSGIPQATIARIESYKSSPNLETLLILLSQLHLKLLVVSTMQTTAKGASQNRKGDRCRGAASRNTNRVDKPNDLLLTDSAKGSENHPNPAWQNNRVRPLNNRFD